MSGGYADRDLVWGGLKRVAVPDSRFHLRFGEFIPDFVDSQSATDRAFALPDVGRSKHVFVTPDNSLTELRRRLLVAGVSMIVSSYNMSRGFYLLSPETIPQGCELYAAWLDGIEHFGRPVDLAAVSALGPFDCMFTGASAVALSGVRFGRGNGYFDLEWLVLSDMGLVGSRTPIVTLVHDVQVLETALYPGRRDILVDWICTPTRTLAVQREVPRPRGVVWSDVSPEQIASNPALNELHRSAGLARD